MGQAAGLIQRGLKFLRRYGPITFLRAVKGYFEQRGRDRQAFAVFRREFPEKFEPGTTADRALDRSAAISLNDLFMRLGIEAEPARVLSLYRERYTEVLYFQFLLDLFILERSVTAGAGGPHLPIVQASELPPLDRPTSRRNILFVTSQFPSPLHGGGNRVLNFLRLLSRSHNIYLASTFVEADDQASYELVKPFCRSILTLSPWQIGGNRSRIRAWLKDSVMDVVHYEWPKSLENFDRAFGRIQIFTYMEAVSLRILMDLRGLQPYSEAWMQKVAELVPVLRLELADAAHLEARVAVTRKDAEFFRGLDPHLEYTILNHGLTFDEFTLPDVPAEPQTLVFVGNYLHYPNMDAMVWFFEKVWPAVRREAPEARILIVGANPPGSLQALAEAPHVSVTGSVPDVRPYIQKAAVCIAPLISGAGLRGKLIEYAALRRTFVATSIAATDLVFEDGRDFLLADEAGEFAAALIRLLKDPSLAVRMGASAYETARAHYDTPRLAEFLERIYARMEGS